MVVTTPEWEARLPPVAAIRAAIERERAARVLAGEKILPIELDEKNPELARALRQRLRWPRDGARRPWRAGIAMVGDQYAPWFGLGNVVLRWSGPSTFCTVWRKLPVDNHPEMMQWRHQLVHAERIAHCIATGHITDAYT